MALSIEVEDANGDKIIRASGEVDLYSSPQLREAILGAAEKAPDRVLVDLSAVPYMDSSGVATLVEGLKSCNQRQKNFGLLKPSPSVTKVLHLSRLDTVFDIQMD